MNGSSISTALSVCEPILCFVALISILLRRNGSQYSTLSVLLVCHIFSTAILVPLLLFGGHGVERHVAYTMYFWIYWIDFVIEAVLSLVVIYEIFDLAMTPLDGIRRLGVLVFRWAVCISVVVVSGSILLPHPSEKVFLLAVITELQRTESVLTLCMLVFVCYAIRPLGLCYRSRIFGIILGLGMLAATKLLTFSWLAHSRQLYSFAGVTDNLLTCAALLIWVGYFVSPEAKRRIVVLPTTSPFLRWNQISEALGDSPGFVAVAGVPPELFAPAELEVMRRASLKMVERSADLLHHSLTA